MSGFFFLQRELLGAIRVRSATLLSVAVVFLLLFLGCFAALFLLPAATPPLPEGLGANEIVAYVSPRLTPAAIDAMYLRLQERADVLSIRSNQLGDPASKRPGGTFSLVARSVSDVPNLTAALRAMDGITLVEASSGGRIELSPNARIGLLCGLVACALFSFVVAREGFRSLLDAFRHEIRLMRFSGVSERGIATAVVVAGLLMGLLAGALLIVGLALYAFSIAEAGAGPAPDVTRLVGVSLISLLLGILMGGLLGLLGAAHLGSSRFAPIA